MCSVTHEWRRDVGGMHIDDGSFVRSRCGLFEDRCGLEVGVNNYGRNGELTFHKPYLKTA
jgi:hypothetical protein